MCSQGVRTRSTIVILICRGRSLNNLECLRRHQKTSDQVLNLELARSRRPRAIHAVSTLPGKNTLFGIPHGLVLHTLSDSRPSISGVIITKKVRYQGEKIGSTFPSSCISPTGTGPCRLGLLAFARSYTHVPRSCCIAMQW